MKRLLKISKWIILSFIAIVLIGAVIIAITGFPKPPAIKTENVPRLPLAYAKNLSMVMNQMQDETTFRTWSRNDDKMFVQRFFKMKLKLHTLAGPGEEAELIEGIPDYASVSSINPDPEKNNLIYSLDKDGNEFSQVYLFDLTSKKSTLISNPKYNSKSAEFSPSGDKILFSSARRNKRDYDLYIMNSDDSASERLLLENKGSIYTDSWSPDEKKIIIRKYISVTEKEPYILDIESAELTPLSQDSTIKADYNWHAWSKDGTKIFYPSTYQSEYKRLHVRDLDTGKDSILFPNINWDVSNALNSPDGKWLIFNVNEDGVSKQYIHYLAKNETRILNALLPFGSIQFAYFHPLKNSTIGFNFIHPSGAIDIYSYDLGTDELIKWSSSEFVLDYPDPEIIHYPTFDLDSLSGKTREITAYYHRPASNFHAPYPVIIDIHGGPMSQALPELNPGFQLDLNRGFAVLVPNVRGSTGYGRTFTNLDNGILRENSVKDIGALLDWVAKEPELDAKRVFVRGASYGGYMTLASAVHYSDRIAGAIDIVGVSNFVTMEENPDKNADRSHEFGDINDPKMRAFLESIAPVNNADKIEVPLLIIQGKNDPRVPVNESRQMVDQLKSEGKEIWYVEASNEGHGFNKPWNALYQKVVEFKFIDDILAGYQKD